MLARRLVTTSALRLPRAISVRFYAEHHGTVARDPGWNKKEKAVEDQYVHNKEVAQLEKLRKRLAKQKAELEEIEEKLASHEASLKKEGKPK